MSKLITVDSTDDMETVIANYAMKGFSITSKTSKRAVLYKKKEFSMLMAVIGFVMCVIGLVIYAILFSLKDDEVIEVVVSAPVADVIGGSASD